MELKNDYPKLDSLRIAHSDGGAPLMGFAVTAQLRFRGGERLETRLTLMDIASDYAAMKGDLVTRYQKSTANRLSRFPAGGVEEAFRNEIESTDPEMYVHSIHLLGDDQYGQVSFQTFAPDRLMTIRYPLGKLIARFSGAETRANPDAIVNKVLEWCNLIKPDQGTVGVAPVFEIGMDLSYPHISWPYLSRFPGFDFDWALNLAMKTSRGIKCVNWLTILDDEYVAELGGRDALAAAMGDAVTIHDWDGGILIRAGVEPQLGDRNQGIWPAEYVSVSNATKSVRFEDYGTRRGNLIPVPEPLDPHEETLNWIRRFDRENE